MLRSSFRVLNNHKESAPYGFLTLIVEGKGISTSELLIYTASLTSKGKGKFMKAMLFFTVERIQEISKVIVNTNLIVEG